jgi:hypothetical protein
MSSLVWLHMRDGFHTYGLEILSPDKYTVENFVYNQVVEICHEVKVRYFIQGFAIRDWGVSWAFVEFFGEGNQDKILEVIEKFNALYGSEYDGKEVQMEEPTREQLISLKLI